jgi:hypothetical protein
LGQPGGYIKIKALRESLEMAVDDDEEEMT